MLFLTFWVFLTRPDSLAPWLLPAGNISQIFLASARGET
jgi:hypothetical protein